MDKKESISYWDSFFSRSRRTQKAHEIVDPRVDFLAPIKLYKNIKILDAGCGKGYSARAFQQENFLVGIDFSKRAIEYAHREFGKTNENVEFILGDLEHLPFKEDVFDVILFSEVLEHISEQKREIVFRGLLHIISSKGQLFLTTPNGMYLAIFLTKILHLLSRGRLRSSITHHIYDHPIFPRSLIKLLKHTGWKVILYKGDQYRIPYTRYNSPKIPLFAIYHYVIAVPS